jgi:hypothetical protein
MISCGWLCGTGHSFLLERDSGKWVLRGEREGGQLELLVVFRRLERPGTVGGPYRNSETAGSEDGGGWRSPRKACFCWPARSRRYQEAFSAGSGG